MREARQCGVRQEKNKIPAQFQSDSVPMLATALTMGKVRMAVLVLLLLCNSSAITAGLVLTVLRNALHMRP